MFAININEKGGESRRIEFDKAEVTIGRVQGNDIILPKGNVSKRHSRIVFKDGKFIIVDLKSTNGTYVNGRKITSPLVIKGTDKVYIGDFILSVEDPASAADQPPAEASAPPLPPPARRPTMPPPPPRKIDRPTAPVDAQDAMDEQGPPPDDMGSRNPFDDDAPPPPMGGMPEALPPEESEPPVEPPPPVAPPRPVAPQRAPLPAPTPRPTVMGSPVGAPAARTSDPNARPTMAVDAPVLPQRPATTMAQPRPVVAPPRPAPIAAPAAPTPASVPVVSPPPAARPAPLPVAAPRPARQAPTATVASPPPAAAQQHHATVSASGDEQSNALHTVAQRLASRVESASTGANDVERIALELVDAMMAEGQLQGLARDTLARDLAAEVTGWGPLGELLADAAVRGIEVARHDRIFIDRDGQSLLSERVFSSAEAVQRVVERMAGQAAPSGIVEARLSDGTQLRAALPPLVRGGTLSLRRPRQDAVSLGWLVSQGGLTQALADQLEVAVENRRNIVVSGGPGSGRSTLLAALAHAVAEGERVITVEDSEEIVLRHAHWVQVSTRGGARAAIEAALRLRPDRLIVDDVRGAEALVATGALAGLAGTMVGTAGIDPADALGRLEGLSLLAADAPSPRALRESLARNVHFIVQLAPRSDGRVRVSAVAEVTGLGEDGHATLTVSTVGN